MKSRNCLNLLLFLGFWLVSAAEGKAIIPDNFSEKTSLKAYTFYSIQPLEKSLPQVVKENNWQKTIPKKSTNPQAIWLRVSLLQKVNSQQLTCLIELDQATECYVKNQRITTSNYVISSVWTKAGIAYYYTFPTSGISEFYLKILPKKTLLPWVTSLSSEEISNGIFVVNTQPFTIQLTTQNKINEANHRISFLIMGGLGIISLISLLIASFWKKRLFFYYAIYGLSPLILLAVKEFCFFYLTNSAVYQPFINTFSRTAEFLQLVSLAAYILFTAELLDIRQNYPRLFKVMKTLAAIMILQGIVEVFWLLITFDIAGYEKLLVWSSNILFPVFIGLIVWMSVFVRHHLVKYVTISNGIFVSILLLTFLRFNIFSDVRILIYLDPFFKLPFATLLEMVVFSFAIAAKISYDNNLRVKSEKQLRETEMMALRSQMNPHFIFNSLNTIRNFILQNDNANANKYLAKFSKLLRQILSYSRSNTISLADEIETVKLYLELESARFKSGFHYEIILSPDLDVDAIRMPPLLLQPYAENAIWHGLRHSNREEKIIWLNFSEKAEALKISIKDNGIGRKAAAKFWSETKDSLGTKITKERIELFNQTENSNISVETIDSPQGTEVILTYRLN